MNDLKSELSGNLEDCLLALLEPAALYDAKCLRRAMRVSKQRLSQSVPLLKACNQKGFAEEKTCKNYREI